MLAARVSAIMVGGLILGCAPPPAAPPPAVPDPPPPAATSAAPAPPSTVMLGGGCEEAKLAYLKECQNSPTACADASKSAGSVSYTAVLNRGDYLNACGVPHTTGVKICAAIRAGHAIAVTVTATPGDARLATCIGKALQAVDFPSSPQLDVATTVFAAQ